MEGAVLYICRSYHQVYAYLLLFICFYACLVFGLHQAAAQAF